METPHLYAPNQPKPHPSTKHPQKPKAPQGASILRQAFEATGRMVRPYLAELEPAAEEDFIRWAQVEVASVEGVGKNSVRCAVRRMEGLVWVVWVLGGRRRWRRVCVVCADDDG